MQEDANQEVVVLDFDALGVSQGPVKRETRLRDQDVGALVGKGGDYNINGSRASTAENDILK